MSDSRVHSNTHGDDPRDAATADADEAGQGAQRLILSFADVPRPDGTLLFQRQCYRTSNLAMQHPHPCPSPRGRKGEG
jgi:hypothetical protein